MASAARKQRYDRIYAPTTTPTPEIRLVADNVRRNSEIDKQKKQHQMFRRICVSVGVCMLVIVLMGVGPVWMMAESTRLSKISAFRQTQLATANAETQELTIKLSAAQSSSRIQRIASNALGMTPPAGTVDYLEISSAKPVLTTAAAAHAPNKVMTTIAQLTASEASALLVGDIGLSSLR